MSFDIVLYGLVTATALLTIAVVLCAAMVLREKADHGLARVASSKRAQRIGLVRALADRNEPPAATPATGVDAAPEPVTAVAPRPTRDLPAGIRQVAGAGTALVIDPLPVEATAATRRLAGPRHSVPAGPEAADAAQPATPAARPAPAEPLPLWQPTAHQPPVQAQTADRPLGQTASFDPAVEATAGEPPDGRLDSSEHDAEETSTPVDDLRQLAEEVERVVVHLDAERERLLAAAPRRRRRRRRTEGPRLSNELRQALDEVANHEPDARDLVVVEREPTSEISVRVVLPETTGHPAARRRGA